MNIVDEPVAKRRFLLFSAARLSGVILVLLGLFVAFGDAVREGGFRQLGGLLIAIGTIVMVVVPLLLKRSWERN